LKYTFLFESVHVYKKKKKKNRFIVGMITSYYTESKRKSRVSSHRNDSTYFIALYTRHCEYTWVHILIYHDRDDTVNGCQTAKLPSYSDRLFPIEFSLLLKFVKFVCYFVFVRISIAILYKIGNSCEYFLKDYYELLWTII